MDELELVEQEANSILDRGREMAVTCDEEYSEAGFFISACKHLVARIKAEFAEPKRKAFEAHRSITAMETRMLEPVTLAMGVVSAKALDYKREQDRLAREEADRIERERRRQEEEKRLEEAARLDGEGKFEEAEAILDAPPEPPKREVRFASPVPKVAGLSVRGTWKARIVNSRLVKREFCQPDQTLINLHVNRFFPKGTQTEKKTLSDEQRRMLEEEIGGVEIYLDEGFSGRVR